MVKNMSVHQKFMHICLMLSFVLFLTSCATVPGTGRSQLSLVDDSSLIQAANSQYASLISESTLSENAYNTAMIKAVGERISQAAERFLMENDLKDDIPSYNWEFNLIKSSEPNAFCMPGGKIVFYTGILPYCKTEAGVAAIMGHEVAHAIAKHSMERSSQRVASNVTSLLVFSGLLMGGVDTDVAEGATKAVGGGVNLLVLLPYSRTHESEADRIGLTLMAMAGYDPREATQIWRRMSEENGDTEGSFFSTHPTPHERITDIENYIPEALPYYTFEQPTSTNAVK